MIPAGRVLAERRVRIPRESGDDPDHGQGIDRRDGIPRESGDDPDGLHPGLPQFGYSPRERG